MKNHNMILLIFLITIAGLLMLTLVAMETRADTIIVAQDGSGDYEKIQDAIDTAGEGDTIRVWEGLYEENIVVENKDGGGGGGFIPGFGAVAVITGIGIALTLTFKKRKKED